MTNISNNLGKIYKLIKILKNSFFFFRKFLNDYLLIYSIIIILL